MWHVVVVLTFPFALAVSGGHAPCKATIFDDNVSKCIINERTDLPSFPDTAAYEVLFCSHPVHGTGSVVVSEMFGFVHSAITLKERNGTKLFSFEFWALQLKPKGVLIPAIENGTLKWSNEAIVTWAPTLAKEVWTHQVSLGITNGTVLNQFMDWVLNWHYSHRYYQLFAVWNQPELGANMQRYFDDTTCNTFTEDGLTELHRLGAPLTSKEVICRTYFVLDAAGPMQSVARFSVQHLEMLAYYDTLGIVLDKFGNMSLRKGLEVVTVALKEKAQPFAFLYDRDGQAYYKAMLQRPYMEAWPMYLSQRMVLPWQPLERARSKECDPWGASDESGVMV